MTRGLFSMTHHSSGAPRTLDSTMRSMAPPDLQDYMDEEPNIKAASLDPSSPDSVATMLNMEAMISPFPILPPAMKGPPSSPTRKDAKAAAILFFSDATISSFYCWRPLAITALTRHLIILLTIIAASGCAVTLRAVMGGAEAIVEQTLFDIYSHGTSAHHTPDGGTLEQQAAAKAFPTNGLPVYMGVLSPYKGMGVLSALASHPTPEAAPAISYATPASTTIPTRGLPPHMRMALEPMLLEGISSISTRGLPPTVRMALEPATLVGDSTIPTRGLPPHTRNILEPTTLTGDSILPTRGLPSHMRMALEPMTLEGTSSIPTRGLPPHMRILLEPAAIDGHPTIATPSVRKAAIWPIRSSSPVSLSSSSSSSIDPSIRTVIATAVRADSMIGLSLALGQEDQAPAVWPTGAHPSHQPTKGPSFSSGNPERTWPGMPPHMRMPPLA